ncbi:MAG: flippase-like domain-containing protein [Actinomycetales bacterium]|nr:flippase-like domain-containing protein [Actinomycetales bacterium]
MTGSEPEAPRSSRRRTIIGAVVSIAILALVFLFLFPRLADYGEALEQIQAMPPIWILALVAASLVNIVVYPFTEIAAIPGLAYRAAFMSRQAAFTVSNIVPGGGAVAVATQYSILAGYRVSPAQAAAAVSADGAWTYLITLGAPSIAVGLLLIEGDSIAGFAVAAIVGLVIVIASIAAITAILRSESGARRLASWVQPLADRLFRLVHKQAPDLTDALVTFHTHASSMVGERWRSLTVTNVAAQFAPMLVLLAALSALGAFPTPLTLIEVFAAYSIALLLTMFPLTPGGLGTVDAALVALLVGFGVDSSTALAADLIWRVVWFLPQLLVGLVALGIYRWDRRRQSPARPATA